MSSRITTVKRFAVTFCFVVSASYFYANFIIRHYRCIIPVNLHDLMMCQSTKIGPNNRCLYFISYFHVCNNSLQKPIVTRWVRKLWSKYKLTSPDDIIYSLHMGRPSKRLAGSKEHSAVISYYRNDQRMTVRLETIIEMKS